MLYYAEILSPQNRLNIYTINSILNCSCKNYGKIAR